MLSVGSSPDKTSANGDPAGHLACLLGSPLEIVDHLLPDNGLYKADQDGWTVLHCASNQGHLHLVKYLIEKRFMNVNFKDTKTKLTCLQLAAINDRPAVIEYLLNFNTSSAIRQKSDNIYGIQQRPTTAGASKLCVENLELFNIHNERTVQSQLGSYLSDPVNNTINSIYSSNTKPLTSHNKNTSTPKKSNLKRKQQSVISAHKASNENSSLFFSSLKPLQEKGKLEPFTVYKEHLTRYKVEPMSVYKHPNINIKSCNDEGHNGNINIKIIVDFFISKSNFCIKYFIWRVFMDAMNQSNCF